MAEDEPEAPAEDTPAEPEAAEEPAAGAEAEAPAVEIPAQETVSKGWQVFGVLFLFVAIGFLVLLAYRAYPAHVAAKRNPNFIDVIFGNNLVVFAARAVLFSAGIVLSITAFYIVYSMIKRMLKGHLLQQFGPLRVQEVQDLSDEVEFWQSSWSELSEDNSQLRTQLEETASLAQGLYEENQTLREAAEGGSS